MFPLLRKALPYLIVAIVAAAAYDGWIFYSRWQYGQEAERAKKEKEAADARRTLGLLGGGELKILNFYGSPGTLHRGQSASICFGVYGAKSVRIEPPVEDLRPTTMHCLQVSPSKTTKYTLVATDGAGHSTNESLTLKVIP
jgi:hypothetical protein